MKNRAIYIFAAILYFVMAIFYLLIAFPQKQTIQQYAVVFSAVIFIISAIGFLYIYFKKKSK